MLLAGKAAELKAKLTQKGGKYLPTAAVLKLMPAGTNSLQGVPIFSTFLEEAGGGDREAALQQYCTAIDQTARVFGSFNYTQETLEEHDRYALSTVKSGH